MKLGRARALLAVLTGICLLALAPGAAGAADAAATTWMVMTTPVNDGVTLTGVGCSSAADCLAVGSVDSGDSAVEAYTGSSWAAIAAPDSGNSTVTQVACPGADYCLAVGDVFNDTTQATEAQAWRWNGSTWTNLPTYNPPATGHSYRIYNELVDVRCLSEDDCEAVGSHTSRVSTYPLAESWNGTSFTNQSTSGAPQGELDSVSCQTSTTCEAAGEKYEGSYKDYSSVTMAMGLSGSHWVTQTTPTLPQAKSGPDSGLNGIACYSGGCLAVGYNAVTESVSVTEKWNGTAWALAGALGSADPAGAAGTSPSAVRCTSASACTMVGSWSGSADSGYDVTLAENWNGSSWTVDTTPDPGAGGSSYQGDMLANLACTATVCYGVGAQAPSTSSMGSLVEKS